METRIRVYPVDRDGKIAFIVSSDREFRSEPHDTVIDKALMTCPTQERCEIEMGKLVGRHLAPGSTVIISMEQED